MNDIRDLITAIESQAIFAYAQRATRDSSSCVVALGVALVNGVVQWRIEGEDTQVTKACMIAWLDNLFDETLQAEIEHKERSRD